MDTEHVVNTLAHANGLRVLADVERAASVVRSYSLPPSHIELLSGAQSFAVYHGYFRLFGHNEIDVWNDRELWKFSWESSVDDYLCFGETVFGDQYAYRLEDISLGRDAAVYELDAKQVLSHHQYQGIR